MSVLVYQQRVIGGGGGGSSSLGGSVITISTEDEELFGQTVTLSKGTYTKSAVFSNEGVAVVSGFEKTGTINVTVDDITQTMDIPYYGEYEVEVSGKEFYEAWLESISHSTEGYDSLDDVFADEKLLRELFTRHASVDFLVNNSDAEEIERIINNDYCAKWVNLRDYALDTLYANETIAALMDTADKYFYGEWVITDSTTTPVTWGPKGNVPVMTSNTAPYGTVSYQSYHNSSPKYISYGAFDGTDNTCWEPENNSTSWLQYQFVNPVCVKKLSLLTIWSLQSGQAQLLSIQLQGSNDGSTFVDLSDVISTIPVETVSENDYYYINANIENDNYYLYYRLKTSGGVYHRIYGLQFYGRELKVSIPTMTSNTTPWGEASASSSYNSSRVPWKAFAWGLTGTNDYWNSTYGGEQWLQYDFKKYVDIKFIFAYAQSGDTSSSITYKVQYYNEESLEWIDIPGMMATKTICIYNSEIIHAQKFRIYTSAANGRMQVNPDNGRGFRLYALDYSEYDWDEDNPRHYIYDHGVQLEALTLTGSVTEESSALKLTAENDQASITIDTTDYILFRGTEGQYGSGTNALICGSGSSNFGSTAGNLPYNHYLDITSINGNNATGVKQTAAGTFTCEEMWLE